MEFANSKDQVHTEQMQDIIGTPPRWLYRWGISLVLGIALICIFISSLIDYPEAVQTRLKLVAVYPPYIVALKDSGRLNKIIVQNECEVKKGDALAIIQSAAGNNGVIAPVSGKLNYAGILRENEHLVPGQHIFYINNEKGGFYGEMIIPQNDVDRVKKGQRVIVKIRNSRDENHSLLKGTIKYITNDQLKNEQYLAEVDFDGPEQNNETDYLFLRNGLMTDAEIIIVKTTLLRRLCESLTRRIK